MPPKEQGVGGHLPSVAVVLLHWSGNTSHVEGLAFSPLAPFPSL